jgi:glycosyltransferase involved in cell wall biosynthesis
MTYISNERSEIELVSVIVPTYNYGHLISETLENLLHQSWLNWECIVVDDGSNDNTAKVVETYCEKDSRFIYHFQKNSGLSAARNTGISLAKGQFIQLLDADDLLESRKLELQLGCFKQRPEVDIVYGEVRYFRSSKPNERKFTMNGDERPWMPGLSSDKHEELACKLMETNLMAVNCPLIRKEVFEQIGPFDIELKSVEDWEYWCRCAIKGKYFLFYSAEDSFALVRVHDGSMSTNLIKMTEASLQARKTLRNMIDQLPASTFKFNISANEKKVTNYLNRLLFQRFKDAGFKKRAFVQLWRSYPLASEFKFLIKESKEILIKK